MAYGEHFGSPRVAGPASLAARYTRCSRLIQPVRAITSLHNIDAGWNGSSGCQLNLPLYLKPGRLRNRSCRRHRGSSPVRSPAVDGDAAIGATVDLLSAGGQFPCLRRLQPELTDPGACLDLRLIRSGGCGFFSQAYWVPQSLHVPRWHMTPSTDALRFNSRRIRWPARPHC